MWVQTDSLTPNMFLDDRIRGTDWPNGNDVCSSCILCMACSSQTKCIRLYMRHLVFNKIVCTFFVGYG